MNKLKTTITVLVAALTTVTAPAITVHTIGDSTMATYDESSTDKRGWGQMFEQFFTGLAINNRGKSGASSKSFYQESAYWTSVKKQISEGDYVLIQFSHNDEKSNGVDGDSLIAYYTALGDDTSAAATDYRGTSPYDTYKEYLRKYVNETRELGATPIFVGPICRRYFSSGDISRSGRHDLGDSFALLEDGTYTTGNKVSADDDTYDYPYQMQQVAAELDVPYIDLTTATADLYLSYGDAQSKALLFVSDDNTHTVAMGATLIARLCAQLLQEADILTEYITLTSELTVSPDTCDLGSAYSGQTLTKEFYVSGFDLEPEDGTVSITCSDGLTISADGTTYGSSLELTYEGGNIVETFYAQLTLGEVGDVSETITVSSGDLTIAIPVTATSIVLADGTYFSAYWRLESSDDCETDGPVTVIGETYSEMECQKYSAPNANTTWPEWTGYDATRKTQRNVIEGSAWPEGEIDEVSTRWIDFAIQSPEGTTLNVSDINFFVCGCGGNGMCCKIYYYVDDNLADATLMASYTKMTANSMEYVSATPVLALQGGQTLHIRFYPWYNSAATGKTLCISDVTISGVAADESTGITSVVSTDQAAPCEYFTADGVRHSSLQPGINIIRTPMADGSMVTKKVIR